MTRGYGAASTCGAAPGPRTRKPGAKSNGCIGCLLTRSTAPVRTGAIFWPNAVRPPAANQVSSLQGHA